MQRMPNETKDSKDIADSSTTLSIFKGDNPDLAVLTRILNQSFEFRVTLFGVRSDLVEQFVRKFVSDQFNNHRRDLICLLRDRASTNKVLDNIERELAGYVLKTQDKEIEQIFRHEMDIAEQNGSMTSFVKSFESLYKKGYELLKNKALKREEQQHNAMWQPLHTEFREKIPLLEKMIVKAREMNASSFSLREILYIFFFTMAPLLFRYFTQLEIQKAKASMPEGTDEDLEALSRIVKQPSYAGLPILFAIGCAVVSWFTLKVHKFNLNPTHDMNHLLAEVSRRHLEDVQNCRSELHFLTALLAPAQPQHVCTSSSSEEDVQRPSAPKRWRQIESSTSSSSTVDSKSPVQAVSLVKNIGHTLWVKVDGIKGGAWLRMDADKHAKIIDEQTQQEIAIALERNHRVGNIDFSGIGLKRTTVPNKFAWRFRGDGARGARGVMFALRPLELSERTMLETTDKHALSPRHTTLK